MPIEILSPEIFARQIENMVQQGSSYLEAVVEFCTSRQIEPEEIVEYLSEKMIMHLRQEGQDLHFLTRTTGLLL